MLVPWATSSAHLTKARKKKEATEYRHVPRMQKALVSTPVQEEDEEEEGKEEGNEEGEKGEGERRANQKIQIKKTIWR